MTSIAEPIQHLAVPIDSLAPYPGNARRGNLDGVKDSITLHGQFRPIVVNRRGNVVLAGNHTMRAMKELGATDIAATFVDVDEDEAARINLVDNRLNDVAEYDTAALVEQLQGLPDLDGTGYTSTDLDELLASITTLPPALTDPDDVPEAPEEPVTKRGDVILLGKHRLMCGDATSVTDVDVLLDGVKPDMVWTDPPYGIEIVQRGDVGGGAAYDIPFGGVKNETKAARAKRLGTANGSKPFGKETVVGTVGADNMIAAGRYAPVIGDDSIQTAVDSYNLCAALDIPVMIFWGGNYYASALPDSSCWIVWDKENTGHFADAELAWTNQKTAVRIFKHMWNGLMKASERGQKRVHPTQKPVALAEWCYEKYGQRGDTVLDLFGGSGVALIAAETTDRTALLMEMSPEYCDVIVTRWQNLTGKTAQRPTS